MFLFSSKKKKQNELRKKILEELKIEFSVNMDQFCNKLFYTMQKQDIPIIQEFFKEEIYNVIEQKIEEIEN